MLAGDDCGNKEIVAKIKIGIYIGARWKAVGDNRNGGETGPRRAVRRRGIAISYRKNNWSRFAHCDEFDRRNWCLCVRGRECGHVGNGLKE